MIFLYIIIFILILSLVISSLSFAPWLPTWKKDLPRIFALADLKQGETFYDLGCGNGKAVIYAAENYPVKAIGLEYALPLYFICKLRLFFLKNENIVFKYKNLFKVDLSQADVVYVFGMSSTIRDKLKQKLFNELKPGARVISYVFAFKDWQPKIISKPQEKDIEIYLYEI